MFSQARGVRIVEKHLRSELTILLVVSLVAGACVRCAPQSASAQGSASHAIYLVGWGDTLESVASIFGMSASELAQNNALPAESLLAVGQRLQVPGPYESSVPDHWQRYKVREGDTIATIALEHHTPTVHILIANRLSPTSVLLVGQTLIIPQQPYREVLSLPKETARPDGAPFRYAANVQLLGREHRAILEGIRGMGFGWLRQQVRWGAIEPEPGTYQWSELDRLVADASAAGVRILLQVGGFPGAETPTPREGLRLTDEEMRRYADLLQQMAARYRGQVQAYEIWDPPNTSLVFGEAGLMPPEEYVKLLNLSYDAVKASDSQAIVVTAALMPTESHNPQESLAHDDYLELMYRAGAKGHFDAVGAQSWGYNNPPADDPTQSTADTTSCKGSWPLYFRSFEALYEVMKRHGDTAKQIWLVKFGWPASTTVIPGYEYAVDNSEKEQATYLVEAYALGRSRSYVGLMAFWNFNYAPQVASSDIRGAYSIINPDSTARLAMQLLASMPK